MADYWLWMACFFIMVIFWKYVIGSWFTRYYLLHQEDKDFSLIQSKHYKRLRNDILSLEKCCKDLEASSMNKVLNKNQCVHLFGKFILAMKGIDKMLSSAIEELNFQSIFEELIYLQKKAKIVRKSCIEQEQWCHSAMFQLQNKETFRELILDLKCCYDTARDVYLFHHPNQSNDVLPILFDAATYEQVLEDGEVLKRKLELVLQDEVSKDYEIAQHLLLRLRNLDRVDGGDLDALEFPNDFKPPKLIKKIGAGSYGEVYKSNWCGHACATKVVEGDLEYLMNCRKEAGIFAGLSHPNLVQFFGCGITQKIGENPKEYEIHEMYLVMELMDSSLFAFLKRAKRPLPYHVAIDIMHQIAKGVYYLHDMQVAHLGLKTDDVLCSSIPMKGLDPCHIFKVTDYGTSQLGVCSNPKHPKPSKYTIGTKGYMSPEVIKGSKTPLYPFQADVWSFAMICSEILSGKVPYHGLKFKDFYNQISSAHGNSDENLRPELPNNCKELTSLIQECWSQDPFQRPTFSNICERLTSLKKSFLKGIYSCKMLPQFGSSHALRDSKFIVGYVPKVEESITLPKGIVVDLDHQLSQAKELLKLNYIGIVGMGGIGKTTLAKAIFDDIRVSSSYHASCFVAECKNYQSSYEILCEILPKLGNDRKPKNLEDAQEMMKDLCIRKKVLLILDDIRDECQVHDVIPPNIVQGSKGTTIIITTRQWSTIKSFVAVEGRLDIEFLDEKASTLLFTTHLSWGEASLSPDFEDLRKRIVKACNGLPLSLKVMGSFLHNKERLRSWERALQGMARGRNLDGDEEIWNTLQISYDGLNDGIEKGMFLDVACFFCRDVYPCGISKATILSMWSKDGILPVRELERLIDMSLLKVNGDDDILEMHDQLRDMGRMIAKDSRIWKASMIPESGFSNEDVEVLEGISLQGTVNHHVPLLKHDQSFEKLRVLILVSAFGNPKAQISNLVFLLEIASQCSQLKVVLIGNSQNLIELSHTLPANTAATMSNNLSNFCGTHASLKILDLIGLEFLEQFPSKFASSNTLLRLNLSSCSNLVSLPKEVGNLSCLTLLSLEDCSSLEALPEEIGNLSSLTTLSLSFCSRLATIPKEVGYLSSLTTLDLTECARLPSLPKEVGNLLSLITLYLRGCLRLEALPKEVGNLSFLITLDLSGCSSLMTLPRKLGNLFSLTTLNLCFCSSLVALPEEVGNLSSLTTLDLRGCSSLVALPKEVGNLSSLLTLDLTGCSNMATLPEEVGSLSSLLTLDLTRCSSLVSLPKEVGNLSSLITLDLSECSRLAALPKEVGNLSLSSILDLRGCSNLATLPKEVGISTSLTTLDLDGCSSLAALSQDVENLPSSLTIPNLDGCSNLATLEISSALTSLISEESLDKAQFQTTGDDKHVLKKKQEEVVLSKGFNNAIQEPLLKLLSFLTIKGLHVLSSLLLWIRICIGMSSQQVLSWNKGKVESKNLLTKQFLGQGCSGIFYETTWSMNCTIKFARKDFPGVSGDTFAMEAIRLFELDDHPNIVKTFCWTVDNRSCSLVMEYMKDDLSLFMRKKKEALRKKVDQEVIGANPSPFQLLEALDILSQIAIGMEYLHGKGVYHCDLKPNNVLLAWKEGRMLVKVADFGLLETKRNTTLLSQRALCFRMIEWSAPELFEDFIKSIGDDLDFLWTTSLTELDPSTSCASWFEDGYRVELEKVDSYSFGLISAYVLGGDQMWPAQLSPQKLQKQISKYGLRPKIPSRCPKGLASLIYACWDKNPASRPTFTIIKNKMQEIIKEQWE